MSVAQSETDGESVTIALADVGCKHVPDESVVAVRELTDDVLEVTRTNETVSETTTYTVELCLGGIAEVTLKDGHCPGHVPGWLEAVICSEYSIEEVVTGR